MTNVAPRVVLTRLLFYALIPLVCATSIACFLVEDAAPLVVFFLYGFIPFALCSVFGMHMMLCADSIERRKVELVGLIAVSAVIVTEILLELGRPSLMLDIGMALGTTSLMFQVMDISRSQGDLRVIRILRLQESLIVPLAVSVTPFFLWLSGLVNPTYDLHLYAFEATYGFQPSVLMVTIAAAQPVIGWTLKIVYYALPLAVVVLYALQNRYAPQESFLVVFVVATVVGFALYFVFPIAGVLQLFGPAFPHSLPPVQDLTIAPVDIPFAAPRNGMPSLHAAWAYLIWFNARTLPQHIRLGFYVFVAITLVATVGLHDAHWLTDLFVSLPLAVALQAALSTNVPWRAAGRWRAVVGGAVLVAIWFALLRFALPVFQDWPGLSWLFVAVSCAISVALYRGLTRAPMTHAAWPAKRLVSSAGD